MTYAIITPIYPFNYCCFFVWLYCYSLSIYLFFIIIIYIYILLYCYIGVTVLIDPQALMTVVGTKMDFVEDPLKSEFVFINPNAKSACGCGESFNID